MKSLLSSGACTASVGLQLPGDDHVPQYKHRVRLYFQALPIQTGILLLCRESVQGRSRSLDVQIPLTGSCYARRVWGRPGSFIVSV
ncbi:hypothetical protein FKM82_017984 [Ascaphus truei]